MPQQQAVSTDSPHEMQRFSTPRNNDSAHVESDTPKSEPPRHGFASDECYHDWLRHTTQHQG